MSSADIRYEQAIVPDRPFPAAKFRCYQGSWIKIVEHTFAVEYSNPILVTIEVEVNLPRNERKDS